MKILFIYRNPDMGYSIGKVFKTIENEMGKYVNIDSCYLPVANYSIKGLYKNIQYAMSKTKKDKYDIIHITGGEHYLIPFIKNGKSKIIVTVHDLESIYKNIENPIKRFVKTLFFIKILKFADFITCISEKTKKEVISMLPNCKKKIATIYNPVGPEFKYTPRIINKSNPTILHIGTKSNKNLENTILALKDFKCHLRIIGKLSSSQRNLLNENNISYSNACNLTDEEILNEYIKCDAVNFPSIYEGFGMPIIEAQSIGRVVITSNISPMKDIVGDSSILINPQYPSSILKGYQEVLKNHEFYIKKGLTNITKFHVGTVVKEYLNIYKNI